MILSILTCHLPNERRGPLYRLHRRLVEQCCDMDAPIDWDTAFAGLMHNQQRVFANLGVEWLLDSDLRGESHISEKRNRLLKRACGQWVCSVDDDDMVNHLFVRKILDAVKGNPDCVGFEGMLVRRGENVKKFIHSIAVDEWFERPEAYYRTPNHLNPIRREIALVAGFPDKVSHGEDHSFSRQVKPLIKTEFFIKDYIMYEYRKDSF